MINTTYGPMDESELKKKTGTDRGDGGVCEWVEYWMDSECIHRSIDVTITGIDNKADIFKM